MAAEGRNWYYKIPYFTNHWLTLSIAFSLFATLQWIDYHYFLLDLSSFFSHYHLWRPITSLFYYPLKLHTIFHFVVNCTLLYMYSELLENGIFNGKPAEYFWLLLFNWSCCVVIGLAINFPFLMDPMVMAVVTVWCQLNKNTEVSSIFRFRSEYLPWVLMAFHAIVHQSVTLEFIGILVGHLAHFALFKYEKYGVPEFISPPAFLKWWFPDAGVVREPDAAPPLTPPRSGHLWGEGRPLANRMK